MKEGMVPYLFAENHSEAVREQLQEAWDGMGLFLWDNKLSDEEELGSLIWQMVSKKTYRICKLELDVSEDDLLHSNWGGKVQMMHTQTISANKKIGPELHDQVPASIGIRRIPPENIHIVKTYDMMSVIRQA